jgi:hypothetical protein
VSFEDTILKAVSHRKPKNQIEFDIKLWPRDIQTVSGWMLQRYPFRDSLMSRYTLGTNEATIITELGEPDALHIASQAFPGYNEKFGFAESERILFFSIWIGHDMSLEQIGYVFDASGKLDRVQLFRS